METESPDEYPSTSSTPLGRRGSYKYGKGMVDWDNLFIFYLMLFKKKTITNLVLL